MSNNIKQKYSVKIVYSKGIASYLSHCNKSEWSKRQAQRHKADILAGKTGITGFLSVLIEEA
jgi:hypothetical protein